MDQFATNEDEDSVELEDFTFFERLKMMPWKHIFELIIVPVMYLPIFLIFGTTVKMRCLYVILVHVTYYIIMVIPCQIIGLLPLVLYPLLGVASTEDVCQSYAGAGNVFFTGGALTASAMMYSQLNKRIALNIMQRVGPNSSLCLLATMCLCSIISIFVPNTVANGICFPIFRAVLAELRRYNIMEGSEMEPADKNTICFFFCAAYAATIGGVSTLISTDAHVEAALIYKRLFPSNPALSLIQMACVGIPLMLAMLFGIWFYMAYFLLDFTKSKETIISVDEFKKYISQDLREMGGISTHEIMISLGLIFGLCLFIVTSIMFYAHRASIYYIVSSIMMTMIVLFFMLPNQCDSWRFCIGREEVPTKSAGALFNKEHLNAINWKGIFIVGSTLAMADAIGRSELLDLEPYIVHIDHWSWVAKYLLTAIFITIMTNLISSVAIMKIFLPMCLAFTTEEHKFHLFILIIYCSGFTFFFAFGSPPNIGVTHGPVVIPTWKFMCMGVIPTIYSLLCYLVIGPWVAPLAFPQFDYSMDTPDLNATRGMFNLNNIYEIDSYGYENIYIQ